MNKIYYVQYRPDTNRSWMQAGSPVDEVSLRSDYLIHTNEYGLGLRRASILKPVTFETSVTIKEAK